MSESGSGRTRSSRRSTSVTGTPASRTRATTSSSAATGGGSASSSCVRAASSRSASPATSSTVAAALRAAARSAGRVARRDRGLEVDHRDRVPDDVVELARRPQPLGQDALAGAFLLRVVGLFVRPACPRGGGDTAAHEQPGDAGGGRQERREAVGEGAVGDLLERHAGQRGRGSGDGQRDPGVRAPRVRDPEERRRRHDVELRERQRAEVVGEHPRRAVSAKTASVAATGARPRASSGSTHSTAVSHGEIGPSSGPGTSIAPKVGPVEA